MERIGVFIVGLVLSAGIWALASNEALSASEGPSSKKDWTRLFDGKSLRGWYPKIQNQKTGEDTARYFQVDDGVIHVYKDQADGTPVPNGYLASEAEYANYHLRMEFKWGTKRFK